MAIALYSGARKRLYHDVWIFKTIPSHKKGTTKQKDLHDRNASLHSIVYVMAVVVAMYVCTGYLVCSVLPLQSHLSAEPYHYRNTFLINSESIFIYFPTYSIFTCEFFVLRFFVFFSHHLSISPVSLVVFLHHSTLVDQFSTYGVCVSSIPIHFMFIWRTLLCINVPCRGVPSSFLLFLWYEYEFIRIVEWKSAINIRSW